MLLCLAAAAVRRGALAGGRRGPPSQAFSAFNAAFFRPERVQRLLNKADAVRLSPHALRFDGRALAVADRRLGEAAHWIVPGRVMIGRYPHATPGDGDGTVPSSDAAAAAAERLGILARCGVDTFVSVNAEVPAQDDAAAWAGCSSLSGFGRYHGPATEAVRAASQGRSAAFFRCPVVDYQVPTDAAAFFDVLDATVDRLADLDGSAALVHCWGGRGRSATVGASLLSVLRPGYAAASVRAIVQRGYDTRGDDGRRSPETDDQEEFVHRFVEAVRREAGR